MRGCRGYLGIWLAAWVLTPAVHGASPPPENLARSARISADSEYSGQYRARFVADGVVPAAEGRDDLNRAWAVQGQTHRDGATIIFQWDEPVTLAEIVYYGRTAWFDSECFGDYVVWAEGVPEPVAAGQFERRHGAQRVTLSKPVQTRRLTVAFTSSHGGPNPGASEIQLFNVVVPDTVFARQFDLSAAVDPYYASDVEYAARPASQRLAADLYGGRLGFRQLLVVRRHALNPSHVYTYHNEGFRAGGGLYRVTPDPAGATLHCLVNADQGQILDCDLSWDATQILFSWRRSEQEAYQVYRVNIDGSGLQRLTDGPSYNFNPCWLPDGDIAFLSTRKSQYAYCWTSPVGVLHRMRPDGREVRRISANYLNDFTPAVMNDGTLIYGRWEYVDRPAIPIQSLWTINPGGSGLSVFYGNRVLSPATFIEPRPIPGSTSVLCTMTAHNGPCRGAIGVIDPSRGVNAQDAIRNLTPDIDIGQVDRGDGNHVRGPYESPWPLDERLFLVSRAGTIVLRDQDHSAHVVVLRPDGPMGFYGPRPVQPRPRPPVLASTAEPDGSDWATVFVRDVYQGLEPDVKRGEVAQIRVVQELEKPRWADVNLRAFGFQFPVVSCGATYAAKRVWGSAEVAADGSAHFRVPAGVPVYFMALDAHGRALQRMRSFTHFAPGEVQGCVGCHESRLSSARLHRRPTALSRPPQALTPPEWGREGFSYAHVVQPVLDRHCVRCHQPPDPPRRVDLSGDKTDFFNVSYETLARQGTPAEDWTRGGAHQDHVRNPYTSWISTYNGSENNILRITPRSWGSPASRLANLVMEGHPDAEGNPRVHLTDAEKRRVFAWIDLNVPYYGTSDSNHRDRPGCRRMWPPDFDRVFQDVATRRCASCHEPDDRGLPSVPRLWYLRIEHPERNPLLLAPLAKAAGGTEACGQAVFADRRDPAYRALLDTFAPVQEVLHRLPRMDMVDPAEQNACWEPAVGPCVTRSGP